MNPTQDRVQRRPQLMRERGQEVVLEATRFFSGGQARQLGLLPARDDHADAGHPYRPTVSIFDVAFALDPPNRAIRRDDSVFHVVRHAEGERALDRGTHAFTLVWV